ncbi:amidase family protein [Ichthyenterobacterium sp. W332]|uniref:Amidase family protein n=1 Tax=Microcosmobacter mediterraneus TaxID=3075607 RepID=A0ABU2YII6_9FLAO|nr:amidase family protein [Ichthyenterobacterium sp. W332]MDT0557050.1 amidase family protein [Ichthyenterobacterium sp. W332]
MRYFLLFLFFSCFLSCKNDTAKPVVKDESSQEDKVTEKLKPADDKNDISAISTKDFREFKVLDSKYLTNKDIWSELASEMVDFTEEDYERLKPYILEQDIPTIQKSISDGYLSYEQLAKFYLHRIKVFDRENPKALNSVISLNPDVLKQAKAMDFNKSNADHPIYGMPILLKDNINASNMPTTAGAVALQDNYAEDAFIVKQLKSKGALILGKANLSEWAYFFCGDCPSGYSAIGGQTLNPYGRRIIDTGGSSSGSGVSVAANFCAAAVGSETSGSILSPASQNSAVGLKPTVGLLSRSGIVPISSTLDTAGPITKNVIDNAIMLDAMFGEDTSDSKSLMILWESGFYTSDLEQSSLQGKRFGAPKRLLSDTLYAQALEVLKQQGAEIIEIEEQQLGLPNFLRLLNIDMKNDLPQYMANYANKDIEWRTVSDIMEFNIKDSINSMPYGQKLFKGIAEDRGDAEFLERIKDTLKLNGKQFFDVPMNTQNLDGFLSINNYHAGFAATAEYPALTVPMGYTEEGVPKGLTFIGRRLQEKMLLQWAYAYEKAANIRVAPTAYN